MKMASIMNIHCTYPVIITPIFDWSRGL